MEVKDPLRLSMQKAFPDTGSPIESMMLCGMVVARAALKVIHFPEVDVPYKICVQAALGKFRVDFLIVDEATGIFVAVECDGHEFHDSSKERAEADKSRDRKLLSLGCDAVLRFTGREIFRDCIKCGVEAIQLLHDRSTKKKTIKPGVGV